VVWTSKISFGFENHGMEYKSQNGRENTVRIKDLNKLYVATVVWFRLEAISSIVPVASINTTCFKSGQK
jgi:hypothetical protein